MIPKPNHKHQKPPKNIPAVIKRQVDERDKHTCQKSGERGTERHHIVPAGMGRRRVHTLENLITLSTRWHKWAQETEEGKIWCENWSRKLYGNAIDLIKEHGHKWKDYLRELALIRINEEGE